MKYKTSELCGAVLDAAVAKASGGTLSPDGVTVEIRMDRKMLVYNTKNLMGQFLCVEEARAFVAHKLGDEVEL